MSLRIAIVCEARADHELATTLIDGLLCKSVDWIDREQIEDYRKYCGLDSTNENECFLIWKSVPKLAKDRGVTFHGFFRGKMPAAPDSVAAMKALLMFDRAVPRPEAVVLLRDSDCDRTRIDGLRQARDQEPWAFPIAIGVAHTKRECWLIAGFEPENASEESLLDQLRGDFPPGVGYDARLYSQHLTAKQEGAKLDAKRVLNHLSRGDTERELRCLSNLHNQGIVDERASENGLKDFYEEIVRRVLPLFRPVR